MSRTPPTERATSRSIDSSISEKNVLGRWVAAVAVPAVSNTDATVLLPVLLLAGLAKTLFAPLALTVAVAMRSRRYVTGLAAAPSEMARLAAARDVGNRSSLAPRRLSLALARSRPTKAPASCLPSDVIELVRRMADYCGRQHASSALAHESGGPELMHSPRGSHAPPASAQAGRVSTGDMQAPGLP
jgi:hypothetical protein